MKLSYELVCRSVGQLVGRLDGLPVCHKTDILEMKNPSKSLLLKCPIFHCIPNLIDIGLYNLTMCFICLKLFYCISLVNKNYENEKNSMVHIYHICILYYIILYYIQFLKGRAVTLPCPYQSKCLLRK